MTGHSCWVNRRAIIMFDDPPKHAWRCQECGHRWLVGEPAQPETELGTPPWARPVERPRWLGIWSPDEMGSA